MRGYSKVAKTAAVRKRRSEIRAKYRQRLKDKIAAFVADKEALYERQRAVGWRQSVEALEKARMQVFERRYKATIAAPTTMADAIALVQFIHDAERSKMNSSNPSAPYGLGAAFIAGIARQTATFLRGKTGAPRLSRVA